MFYRLFNILYKLTSRRGLKVFALTCVIIFIISFVIGVNQSHAMSTEDLQTYGSTLTYWNNNIIGRKHNSLRLVSMSGDFGYKLEYYTGSDRTDWYFFKMSPGYIYAVKNSSSSAKSFNFCFIDDISQLPNASGETLILPSATNSGIGAGGIPASGYKYFSGRDCWLGVQIIGLNIASADLYESKYPVLQSSGGGGGSSIDYTSYFQDTINELQDINSTLLDIQTDTGAISGDVASILSILQSSSSSDITTAITNQTTQQQNNYNTFTNTSSYDNSVVNIDSTDYAVTDSQRC